MSCSSLSFEISVAPTSQAVPVIDLWGDQMRTITALAAKSLGKFLAKDFRQIFLPTRPSLWTIDNRNKRDCNKHRHSQQGQADLNKITEGIVAGFHHQHVHWR